MADGALRTDVLKVLGEEGVTIETLPGSRYRLSKGEALLTVRLLEVVSRTTLSKLERRFDIAKAKFFPPIRAVLTVLPKASGQPK